MTIRALPALPNFHNRSGLSSELAPSALAKWMPDIRAAADDAENVISILAEIGESFFGEGVTARRVSAALRSIGQKDVVVHLNSPGGNFFEGLAIYNVLREHKAKVTVKVLGMAASAASVVMMAGDEIQIAKAGFMMMHNTWVLAVGDRHDLREFADTLEPFDKVAAEVYQAVSGLDVKEIAKMMDKETWLAGSDAVDKGFADSFLPADEVKRDAKALGDTSPQGSQRRVEMMLAKAGVPRPERHRLITALKNSGTRDAADDASRDAGVTTGRLGLLLESIAIR